MRGAVLLTGGTGFLGQALLQSLPKIDKRPLIAAARTSTPSFPKDVQVERVGSLDEDTDWTACLRRVDIVIHLAARVHILNDHSADPLTEYRRVNVLGTLNLARQAAQAGVRRFVYISSIKVNGERTAPNQAFHAGDIPAPEDVYGISKLEAEQGLMDLAHKTGMEVVIIRPPLVYGPGVKGNFSSMARWVRKGLPLPLGAVNNKRSLVALDNLVDLIALCADPERSPRAANEVFLVSDDEAVSTTELLRKLAQAYGVRVRLLPVPTSLILVAANMLGKAAVADRLLGSLVVDNTKTRELLGWKPTVSMDEQLRKMALYDTAI